MRGIELRSSFLTLAMILGLSLVGAASPGLGQAAPASAQSDNVVWESLAGNVYEPGRWRPLDWRTLFSDGWNEAWASPPNGEGGAPRQGWLNAYDGVFYRLFLLTFNYAHDVDDHGGDNYLAGLTAYTPLNRRFQLRWDVPFVTSIPTAPRGATCRSRRGCCCRSRATSPTRSTSPCAFRPATRTSAAGSAPSARCGTSGTTRGAAWCCAAASAASCRTRTPPASPSPPTLPLATTSPTTTWRRSATWLATFHQPQPAHRQPTGRPDGAEQHHRHDHARLPRLPRRQLVPARRRRDPGHQSAVVRLPDPRRADEGLVSDRVDPPGRFGIGLRRSAGIQTRPVRGARRSAFALRPRAAPARI